MPPDAAAPVVAPLERELVASESVKLKVCAVTAKAQKKIAENNTKTRFIAVFL
jgi:hypothetical protein